ncbi:FAD-dependent oxidoreductase [Swingsia samuiensis]|uniref:Rubredoxin-NAD(+) reductase n=1 Tax=Swingsia samuiensis TaxID=1293412 RepID=A0A4Y6UN43_9PROT|nr:FAD-dependent oxidoreductase [Swingsia samuiensis]QDH17465.1 rubredoxin-NAD(+) reductase [Swingsia samuiensis]
MPESDFRDLVAFDELEDGKITTFSVKDKSIILIRDGENVYALDGKCPHKHAPMGQGVFCKNDREHGVVVCPWHKAVFRVQDGGLEEPVALEGLASYSVDVRDGRVFVSDHAQEKPSPQPKQENESVLILGGGAAGVTAATTLREEGFAGKITLVLDEKYPPYDRTALSKTVLLSTSDKAHAPKLLPQAFYTQHNIEIEYGTVVSFDPENKCVVLEDAKELTADHIIIATGSKPKTLDIPGGDLKGVFSLHREVDAETIVAGLAPAQAVTIIGSGFIGLEVASCLRQRGLGVTIISDVEIPMEKQFGREVGMQLRQMQEENSVAFISDARVVKIYGEKSAEGVELDDGMRLPSAFVLASVGVKPSTEYVQGLERDADGAIIVDGAMRAAPNVYAVGDASAVWHAGEARRVEHWRHAQVQGRIAAFAIMGREGVSMPTPWFWTQQFGKKLEYLGWGESFNAVNLEGDIRAFNFLATYMNDGKVVGIAASGYPQAMAKAAIDFQCFADDQA